MLFHVKQIGKVIKGQIRQVNQLQENYQSSWYHFEFYTHSILSDVPVTCVCDNRICNLDINIITDDVPFVI